MLGLGDPAATHARQLGNVLFVAWLVIAVFAGYQAFASDLQILRMLRRQLRLLRRHPELLVDARQRDSGLRAIELMLYGRTVTKAGLLRHLNPKIYVVDDPAEPTELGPFPADWFARQGRVVLTGEYGGKAGFRHVLDGLGIELADGTEDLVFSLVQLCASAPGKPLTDDALRLIAGYPRELALLFPGQLS